MQQVKRAAGSGVQQEMVRSDEMCALGNDVPGKVIYTKERCALRKGVKQRKMCTKEECAAKKDLHQGIGYSKERCDAWKTVSTIICAATKGTQGIRTGPEARLRSRRKKLRCYSVL